MSSSQFRTSLVTLQKLFSTKKKLFKWHQIIYIISVDPGSAGDRHVKKSLSTFCCKFPFSIVWKSWSKHFAHPSPTVTQAPKNQYIYLFLMYTCHFVSRIWRLEPERCGVKTLDSWPCKNYFRQKKNCSSDIRKFISIPWILEALEVGTRRNSCLLFVVSFLSRLSENPDRNISLIPLPRSPKPQNISIYTCFWLVPTRCLIDAIGLTESGPTQYRICLCLCCPHPGLHKIRLQLHDVRILLDDSVVWPAQIWYS